MYQNRLIFLLCKDNSHYMFGLLQWLISIVFKILHYILRFWIPLWDIGFVISVMDVLHLNSPGKIKSLLHTQWEEWVNDEDIMQSNLFLKKRLCVGKLSNCWCKYLWQNLERNSGMSPGSHYHCYALHTGPLYDITYEM